MSIEDIVRSWKANEGGFNMGVVDTPENPVGQEISEHDLQQVAGGLRCDIVSCGGTPSCLLIASASYTTTSF